MKVLVLFLLSVVVVAVSCIVNGVCGVSPAQAFLITGTTLAACAAVSLFVVACIEDMKK